MAASKLLKHPMRIIANCEEKLTQSGAINTSISYRQLIFCSRKNKRVKTNNHKQISFLSLKNYSMDNFERELLCSQATKSLVTLTPPTVIC